MSENWIGDSLDVKILKALDSPRFKARTVEGIACELKVDASEVRRHLIGRGLADRIVQVPGIRKNNRPLYVTLERYKKNTPLAVRVFNMIRKDRSDER